MREGEGEKDHDERTLNLREHACWLQRVLYNCMVMPIGLQRAQLIDARQNSRIIMN